MSDCWRRVSVQATRHDHCVGLDLALPAALRVGDVIPSIVDLAGIGAASGPGRWRLSRIGGPALDESMTLADHDIHDGDLLVLSAAEPPVPALAPLDLAATIACGAPRADQPARLKVLVCLWLALAGAAVLVWTGPRTGGAAPAVTAAVLALAAGLASVAVHLGTADRVACLTGGVAAAGLAGVSGFLAVPGGPAAANVLLAGSAAAAVATVRLRVTGCGTVCLTALATASAVAALAAAVAVVWPMPPATVGAGLATAALGLLGVAPRLVIVTTGLAPALPAADGPPGDDDAPADDRVRLGHRVLTGLVIGLAGAAALGVLVVAAACVPAGWPASSGFGTAVGLALALRSRTHTGGPRRTALLSAGILCCTAAFIAIAAAVPHRAYWLAALAVGAGLAVLAPVGGTSANPIARRAVDLLEYAALAAVLPLACWVADLYAVVRGASLS